MIIQNNIKLNSVEPVKQKQLSKKVWFEKMLFSRYDKYLKDNIYGWEEPNRSISF